MSDRTQEDGRSYYTEREYKYTPSSHTGMNDIRMDKEWQNKLLWATGEVVKDGIEMSHIEGDTWEFTIDQTKVDLRGGNTVNFVAVGENIGFEGPGKMSATVDIVIKNI